MMPHGRFQWQTKLKRCHAKRYCNIFHAASGTGNQYLEIVIKTVDERLAEYRGRGISFLKHQNIDFVSQHRRNRKLNII